MTNSDEQWRPVPDELAESVSEELTESLDEVDGYRVRVDAGEEGRIWIALRDAAEDAAAADSLFQRVDELLGAIIDEDEVRYAISVGRTPSDHVLVCGLSYR